MNHKRIKRLSTVLALALITSLAGACQPTENTDGTTTGGPTTAPPTTTSPGTDETPTTEEPGESSDETSEPGDTEPVGDTITLRFGTHHVAGIDPNYQDEITGEYTMLPDDRVAALAALDILKQELNVEFEFVNYPADVREIILQSVMAGDPIADIALLWGGSEGTILAQNVLQPLNDYIDEFQDPEYSWMLTDEIFDNQYFLNSEMLFHPAWPLVYNVNLIEEVDALKENGETVYPTDLFEAGTWTWSAFEDYLTKIDAHFADSQAPLRPERRIRAYQTDWRFTARQAAYAAGGYTYNSGGIGVAEPEFKKAMDWIEDLYDAELLTSEVYDGTVVPLWTDFASQLMNGETVFTDAPHWRLPEMGSVLAERSQSMGIVPFPREDSLSADSDDYQLVTSVANTLAIPKGIDEERTQLALDAIRVYYHAYYTQLGGVDTIQEYRTDAATTYAATKGFDILNENNGEGILNAFLYIADNVRTNEFSTAVGIASDAYGWDMVLNHSVMNADGYSRYSTAIDEWIGRFEETVDQIGSALKQEEIIDNIQPNISTLVPTPFAFELGTDFSTVDWTEYLEAEDGVDGVLDITAADINTDAVDTAAAGTYEQGLVVKIADAAGNERESKYNVAIYDPANTEAPVLTIKEEYRTVNLDEDTAAINWAGDFVESAADAHGNDLKQNVTADLSTLDTTTPGEYEVTLAVTDFAGNETSETITVTVAAPEE